MEFHLPHSVSPPAYSLAIILEEGLWDKLLTSAQISSPGEAVAMRLLETEESTLRRGILLLTELVGYEATSGGHYATQFALVQGAVPEVGIGPCLVFWGADPLTESYLLGVLPIEGE